MTIITRIEKVELIGPTAIGVRLADDNGQRGCSVVISPNNFITDFSTFLTALRAAGATSPVQRELLENSWREARRTLQKRLVEEDPWGQHAPSAATADEPPEYWSMVICMGEERARKLLKERRAAAALT
jgi:hypothetical protein